MVGSHKILTVSYGTFSCTLEGFDDSFGTMKAIAEYFRDLAADDRYFGAEPPTPDAEMLTRIAEREIARRVEARLDAGGIVLRATGPGRAEAVAAPAAAPAAAPVAAPAAAPVAPTVADLQPASSPITEPPAAQPAAAEGRPADSIAAAEGHDPVPLPAAAASAGQASPVGAQASQEVPPAAPEAAQRPAPAATVVMPPMARMPQAPAAAAPVAARPGPRIISAPRGVPAPADDTSVAAKLQRIRAVVGKADVPVGESEEAAAMPVEAAPIPMDIAMATVASPEPVGDLTEAAPRPERDVRAAAAQAPLAGSGASADPETAADAEAEAPLAAQPALPGEPGADAATDPQPEPAAAAPEGAQPIRARVIRMRRADFERVVAQGGIDPPAALAAPAAAATLSAAAEADLMAELAAVEQEAALFAAVPQDDADDAWEPGVAATTPAFGWDEPEAGSEPDADDARMAAVMAALDDDGDAAAEMRDDGERDAAPEDDGLDLAALALALGDVDPVTAAGGPVAAGVDEGAGDLDAALLAAIAADDATDEVDAADEVDATDATDADEATAEDEAAEDEAMAAEHDLALAAAMAPVPAAESDEDEDAAYERIDQPDDPDGAAEDAASAAGEPPAVAAVTHEHLRVQTDEAALSRILSQTDAHLNTDEASRRRAAITQLRAAVAATEAARRLGEAPEDDDDEVENAFRDDLKQAVRPRRPVPSGEARSDRPRPAPLKLVASQRIDQPAVVAAPPSGQPIRPRRVSVARDDTPAVAAGPAGTRTFEDYAREVGASTLPDLLEAAAAYTSFVEGVEDFSRPQLMKKVTGLDPARFNREDTLRSFGTLLREGRITRSGMGRFQVSPDNRFHPSRRAG